MEGKVQKFQVLKGYGFILRGFRERVFFHVSSWKSDTAPRIGMVVTFDLAPAHKPGLPDQAINVVPVESSVGGAK
jgi:cold shock CspA family protein